MFIYSFRAATLKFLGIICVTLVALIAIIAFVPIYAEGNVQSNSNSNSNAVSSSDVSVEYSYDKIKGNSDVMKFLSQFGWTVNGSTAEVQEVTIPAEFDKVFASYNALQREQGLDLAKYKKKELTRYTFEVTNYEGYEGKVYANVLVYRNKVVGGDICSADVEGFVHGFEKKQ